MKVFTEELKKRNDELGTALGVKKINVEDESIPRPIYVKVEMLGPNGPLMVPQYLISTYKALGLSIRGKE